MVPAKTSQQQQENNQEVIRREQVRQLVHGQNCQVIIRFKYYDLSRLYW